jgi:F-type H+-transporting ATPase subunit gamma
MRSVQNIAKITSAMKMVAASKMRVAQQATENSRGIAEPLVSLLGDRPGAPSHLITTSSIADGAARVMSHWGRQPSHYRFCTIGVADVDVGKNVVVPITSDKGLCGGINSTVCKQARAVYHVVADEGR